MSRKQAERSGQLHCGGYPGTEHICGARCRRKIAGLLQCVPAPWTRTARWRRQHQVHYLSVSRVGLQSRRHLAPRTPLRVNREFQRARCLPEVGTGRSFLPPGICQSRPGRGAVSRPGRQSSERGDQLCSRSCRAEIRASPEVTESARTGK